MAFWKSTTLEKYDAPKNTLLTVAILQLRRWDTEADAIAGKPHTFEFVTPRHDAGINGVVAGDHLDQAYLEAQERAIVTTLENKLAKAATIVVGQERAVSPIPPVVKSAEQVAYEAARRKLEAARVDLDRKLIDDAAYDVIVAEVKAAQSALDAKGK